MLRVSEVKVNLIKPDNGLIGFASLVVNEAMFLSGIGIHSKLDGSGYRLTYPTRKSGTQVFDIFHSISRPVGKAVEDAILARLNDVLNRLDHDRHDSPEPA